jgi:outer membrane receptor protein involved in Fe transport
VNTPTIFRNLPYLCWHPCNAHFHVAVFWSHFVFRELSMFNGFRSRYTPILAVALCAGLLTSVPSAIAQTSNGQIIGVVTDPTGAVIPDAAITITNTQTNVKTQLTSDRTGSFKALSLQIGTYKVSAEKPGFSLAQSPEYQIGINQTQRVDFKLALPGTVQTVEVTIAAAALDTVSATIGGSVTERPLVDLPLNGRNILDLASLQPGVTTGTNPGNTSAGGVSIAGGRTDSVTYLLDGGNNASLLNNGVVFSPNPDAVEEFRILENNYTAEYGRNGGGVISVVSKSGTRNYHGSLFEFARNPYFNANTFFNKRTSFGKNDLKRHQYGGTFGGEFYIPKVLERRDRFFYFFSYEGQKLTRSANLGIQQIASTAEVNGDFSAADPDTNSAVVAFLQSNPYFQMNAAKAAQGIIDSKTFDPVAKKYIAAGIFPSSATGFVTSVSKTTNNFNQYNGKFDFVLTNRDHLTVSLAYNNNPTLTPFAGGATTAFPVTGGSIASLVNIDETHQFSSHVLNDARAVAQRLNSKQAIPASTLPTPTQLGIGITPDEQTGPTILTFDDTGDQFGFSPQGPTTLINNTFAYSDDLSVILGKHSMKAGIYFSPYQNNTQYDFYVNGDFEFAGLGNGNSASFAEFLVGQPDYFTQFGAAPSNIRSKDTATYLQDQWQALKSLTLSFGVRYEYASPKIDTKGRSFSLVSGAQSQRFTGAPKGLLFPGDPGAPTGANFPIKNDFGPRFGLAYDVGGVGRTVIRGGVGLFFDILKGEDNLQFNGQAPFFGYEFLQFPSAAGATGPLNYYETPFAVTGTVNTFPSKAPTKNLDFDAAGFLPFGGGGVYFVDPNLRTPYTTQYNLGVQQSMGHGVVLEVAYVGSLSRKYTALIDSNPFILGTSTRSFQVANGNPTGSQGDKGYTYLDTFKNLTNANYNSLQASLRKQTSHVHNLGTTYFQLSYTFAKNMDNVSGFRQRNSHVASYNPNLFYAASDTNVPQRVVLSGGWDLPFDDFAPRLPKLLTKGWSLYPIASYQSGFPLDVSANLQRSSSNPGPTGAGDQELVRVNLVGGSVKKFNPYASVGAGNGAPYVSKANFDKAVTTGYGTLSRNSFYGPGYTNVDMSIVKALEFEHGIRFELRGDFFNIANHAEFQAPVTTIGSATFGEITTTYDPRIIQLAAKLKF